MSEIARLFNVLTYFLSSVVQEWLANPNAKPGAGTGEESIAKMVMATRGLAKSLSADKITAKERAELLTLCDDIDGMMGQLNQLREK